jgi:hypothetical protein
VKLGCIRFEGKSAVDLNVSIDWAVLEVIKNVIAG